MGSLKTIISVGLDLEHRLPHLPAMMRAGGLRLVEAASPAEMRKPLEESRQAVVVVYNPPRQTTARDVLEAVASRKRKTPVIVLVDQSDLDEYYQLMCEGAFDYFELGGDPRWVERSLRSATRQAAASGPS